jgi:hypothetical protein
MTKISILRQDISRIAVTPALKDLLFELILEDNLAYLDYNPLVPPSWYFPSFPEVSLKSTNTQTEAERACDIIDAQDAVSVFSRLAINPHLAYAINQLAQQGGEWNYSRGFDEYLEQLADLTDDYVIRTIADPAFTANSDLRNMVEGRILMSLPSLWIITADLSEQPADWYLRMISEPRLAFAKYYDNDGDIWAIEDDFEANWNGSSYQFWAAKS